MEGSDLEAELSQRLHEAARNGDVEALESVLATGVVHVDDPNRDSGGCTAILEATRENQAKVAAVLLKSGCDPGAGDNRGWTALHDVLKSPDVGRLLLASEVASWNIPESACGLTPLHASVKCAVSSSACPSSAQLEILKEVLRKSHAEATTWTGDTALHLAAAGRHDRPEVMRILLSASVTRNVQNSCGETPLHLAIINGNYMTALVLIEEVNGNNSLGTSLRLLNRVDSNILKESHQKGCKQLPGRVRRRPISQDESTSEDEVQSCDSNQNALEDEGEAQESSSTNTQRRTSLSDHEAAESKQSGKSGSDAVAVRIEGGISKVQNALQEEEDHDSIPKKQPVDALEQKQDSIDQGEPCHDKHTQTVDRLRVDLCDRFGQSVLHYCASRNATSILEPLLRNYGACNVKDLQGDTALHDAARRGHGGCVKLLLDAGVDSTLRNNSGMTALDLAVSAGFPEATGLLYEHATAPVLRDADALRRQDSVRRCTVIGKMFLSAGAHDTSGSRGGSTGP